MVKFQKEETTMKLTKFAGAFALTAAMAMTAVPAFAAADATNVEQFTDAGNNTATAQTKVYAQAINTSLNAEIPTRVAIVIPSTGAAAFQAPTSEAYKITNKGTNAIYLKAVAATSGSLTIGTVPATAGVPNTTGLLQNTIDATVGVGSFKTALSAATGANGAQVPSATPVQIAAGQEAGIDLSGNVGIVNGPLSSNNLNSAVMTISYTIGLTA